MFVLKQSQDKCLFLHWYLKTRPHQMMLHKKVTGRFHAPPLWLQEVGARIGPAFLFFFQLITSSWFQLILPSGKHTKNYGKSPFLWVNPLFQWPFSIAIWCYFDITRPGIWTSTSRDVGTEISRNLGQAAEEFIIQSFMTQVGMQLMVGCDLATFGKNWRN